MTFKTDVGVIGLAVMGSNLVLNMESHGQAVLVYNRTTKTAQDFVEQHPDKQIAFASDLEEFVSRLKTPRKILLMVKAGPAVGKVIEQLLTILSPGDLIMDGGNSLYSDSKKRQELCNKHGVLFLGVGVSGGEEGALHGPSIMVGGDRAGWHLVKELLSAISARAPEPCVAYLGNNGAGHFVKMVHNGIEYAIMQLIAETCLLLNHSNGMDNQELSDLFSEWNLGELNSYLVEITSVILAERDPSDSKSFLVDSISDRAGQKGTGKWTIEAALRYAVPVPCIASALDARSLSSSTTAREVFAANISASPLGSTETMPLESDSVRNALYCGMIVSFLQGLLLIEQASKENGWDLDLATVCRIWKGGCIIRAGLLDILEAALDKSNSVLQSNQILKLISENHQDLRSTVISGVSLARSIPVYQQALSYIDTLSSTHLPLNIIQAQRDLFGAHTFERRDNLGVAVHHNWPSLPYKGLK